MGKTASVGGRRSTDIESVRSPVRRCSHCITDTGRSAMAGRQASVSTRPRWSQAEQYGSIYTRSTTVHWGSAGPQNAGFGRAMLGKPRVIADSTWDATTHACRAWPDEDVAGSYDEVSSIRNLLVGDGSRRYILELLERVQRAGQELQPPGERSRDGMLPARTISS